jgi:glucose/arabinose dehydrogenase
MCGRALLAVVVCLLAATPAGAALELRGGGIFREPVAVAAPPGDQRLFVVELTGRIRILGANQSIARRPFLDLRKQVKVGAEQGLLGLAFAPDYATSKEFYIFLTARPKGQIQVRRYRAASANRADPASATTILRIDKTGSPNHNGGTVRVGPDGDVWVGIGDGSISNDNFDNGQNLSTLFGKILRLARDGTPAAGNPDLGAGARPEIWQYGLRNPFRFSFDRATGDLVIGDVGQSSREEIDWAPAAQDRLPGANWGWPCFEGTLAHRSCAAPGAFPPASEADHTKDGARAVAAGVVVRDPGLPTLAGRFLYGDLGYNRLHSVALATGHDRPLDSLIIEGEVSVDEDGCGRPLVTSINGRVARIVDGRLSTCARALSGGGSTKPVRTPLVPAPPACGLALEATRPDGRRDVIRHGVRVRLHVLTRCRLVLNVRAGNTDARARTLRLLPGARRRVVLKLDTDARRALGHRLTVRALATYGRHTVLRRQTLRLGS